MSAERRVEIGIPVRVKHKIVIPPYVPATPEELAKRRALAERVDRLRAKMPSLGMSTSELIRQVRDEADGLTDGQESDG